MSTGEYESMNHRGALIAKHAGKADLRGKVNARCISCTYDQMAKLTPKQRLFTLEYLRDMNSTQAAIRAGYSEKTARKIGSENLTKPDIAAAIHAALQERMERIQVDSDWVLREQVRVYERCMQDTPVLDRDGNPTGEYRFDAAGANRALELIDNHTSVNAFKPNDDDGQPIDQNWVVRVVHTSKEEFKKISKQ